MFLANNYYLYLFSRFFSHSITFLLDTLSIYNHNEKTDVKFYEIYDNIIIYIIYNIYNLDYIIK